jgi:hypothetical protein
MTTKIERLKGDVRGAEFLGHTWVPVQLADLNDLLALARAVAELPEHEPTTLAEWGLAIRKFEAVKATAGALLGAVPA